MPHTMSILCTSATKPETFLLLAKKPCQFCRLFAVAYVNSWQRWSISAIVQDFAFDVCVGLLFIDIRVIQKLSRVYLGYIIKRKFFYKEVIDEMTVTGVDELAKCRPILSNGNKLVFSSLGNHSFCAACSACGKCIVCRYSCLSNFVIRSMLLTWVISTTNKLFSIQ